MDLVNNNISRYVLEEYANRLYKVYTVYIYIAAIWMMENSEAQ